MLRPIRNKLLVALLVPIGVNDAVAATVTAPPRGIDGYVQIKTSTPSTFPEPSAELVLESDGNGLGAGMYQDENLHKLQFWMYNSDDTLSNPQGTSPNSDMFIRFRLLGVAPFDVAAEGDDLNTHDFRLREYNGADVPYDGTNNWYTKWIPPNTAINTVPQSMTLYLHDDPNAANAIPEDDGYEAILLAIVQVDCAGFDYHVGDHRSFRWIIEEND